MSMAKISIENTSDNVSYQNRVTTMEYPSGGTVTIDGEKSSISCGILDNSIKGFSGYFPRLLPGVNNIKIKIIGESAYVIFKAPVARWIT